MITQKELKELFHYNPDTGIFTRLKRAGNFQAGSMAGSYSGRYARICIRKRGYLMHRLAWLYIYGEWPEEHIDHINHNRYDNRLANLRSVEEADNHRNRSMNKNNTSGCNGVTWDKSRGKWMAAMKHNNKHVTIGRFLKKEDAIKARREADKHYGFHENHGNPNN